MLALLLCHWFAVQEKLVYGGKKHNYLAALPDMWDRTLTVSSCGKTFSSTGWKVGWVYGAAHLVKPVMLANQWVQFCVSTPTQKAVAEVLQRADDPYEGFPSYYKYINHTYEQKMNGLVDSLRRGNFAPIVPDAGYFIIADTSAHAVPERFFAQPAPNGQTPTRDWAFARWLTEDAGITPIPPSAFYTPERSALAANLARFAFCKRDETLVEADRRFIALAARSAKTDETSAAAIAK
jgi:kynurenine---oxoglutarate transaminase / cysteine-S-conjugate beta-lyase / glutamine---phenylpyruvate transaminase